MAPSARRLKSSLYRARRMPPRRHGAGVFWRRRASTPDDQTGALSFPMSVATGEGSPGYDVKPMRGVVMPASGCIASMRRAPASTPAAVSQVRPCARDEVPARGLGRTARTAAARSAWSTTLDDVPRMVPHHGAGSCSAAPSWEFSAIGTGSRTTPRRATPAEPNAMWAEAPGLASWRSAPRPKALRKAFPEAVGSQPTAEEMEEQGLHRRAGHGGAEGSEQRQANRSRYPVADFERTSRPGRARSPLARKPPTRSSRWLRRRARSARTSRSASATRPSLSRDPDFPLEGDEDDAQQQPVHGEDA